MKKKSSWTFYEVRIIKQIVIEGAIDARLIDPFELVEEQTFEESIMVVKAHSFDHAYKLAIHNIYRI